MSRLGKTPIAIPDKVNVTVAAGKVQVEGPLGKLSLPLPERISVAVDGKVIHVAREGNDKQRKAAHGTTRAHLANMVRGVAQGFEKTLDITGVGYSASVQGDALRLVLGYSHPIDLKIPAGLKVECPSPTAVVVKGSDRQQVGQFAAVTRRTRPVEPYNLKGIKYRNEIVKKKAGKTFVTGAS